MEEMQNHYRRAFTTSPPNGKIPHRGHFSVISLLTTLSSEDRKVIKGKPERINEVNKEIEASGAKILQQYAVLGTYDFVNIVEVPNTDIITRV